MNRRHQPPPRRLQNPAYRPAFERLDAALAKNFRSDDIEKIQRARLALFGSAPGTVAMPE
jgi:hypothetical protein